MSERATGASRRSSARRSFSEHSLPLEYLERLEQKRKQLDESIHKYIAAKEREYKQFEKELKQEHKLSQGQDGHQEVSQGPSQSVQDPEQSLALQSHQREANDALVTSSIPSAVDNVSQTSAVEDGPSLQQRSLIAKLQDGMGSSEREQYLAGLFTPSYLSALETKAANKLKRATSDPTSTVADQGRSQLLLDRTGSDVPLQAKPDRPAQLVIAQRTSSSGSSADGKLASAMRSPTQRPKRKRVSLAVGDSIVAPSDNVPDALSHYTTSSHSRKRAPVPDRDHPESTKRAGAVKLDSSALVIDPSAAKPKSRDINGESSHTLLPAVDLQSSEAPNPSSKPRKLDPDGDLFGLEDEDSDSDNAQPGFNDLDDTFEDGDDGDIAGRVHTHDEPISPLDAKHVRYDPTSGLIPEPEDESEDSAVPQLAFGSNSAVAPTEPGFRRPSVIDDPVYVGPNYAAAEQMAIERDVYGSSANRPSSKGSFTAGSLGESYMAKHAEEMMRLRLARQHTPVES